MTPLEQIESNFLRLVKLFHAHKDSGDAQARAMQLRLDAIEKVLADWLDSHAPEEK